MKFKTIALMMVAGMLACLLITTASPAAEILTAEDLRQMVVTEEQLVKTADNGIILFDASRSMKRSYLKTGRSMSKKLIQN